MTLTVNGEKIEDKLIQHEADRLRPDYKKVFTDQSEEEQETQLLEWSRENVLERVLLTQEAKLRDMPISSEDLNSSLEEIKKRFEGNADDENAKKLGAEEEKQIKLGIETQMRVEKLIEEVTKDAAEPSKEDIKKYYEENKEQFKTPERLRVSHIVKHLDWQTDEKKAQELLEGAAQDLEKGVPFEDLAAKFSDCPDSGGDLGFITRGQMVEEFEDVVFNLGIGQYSGVFRTRFGFHIAKLYDRQEASCAEIDKVSKDITELLQKQQHEDLINTFVDELKNKAKIEEA